jgi:hypothetical protein
MSAMLISISRATAVRAPASLELVGVGYVPVFCCCWLAGFHQGRCVNRECFDAVER